MSNIQGRCLCGKVSFEISGPMPRLYQCHCSLCRKQSGAASNAATIVEERHFRWLSGQDQIKSWVKDSGYRTDFCSCCGSPVPNPLRDLLYYWVPAGLLDETEGLEVAAHLSLDSKAAWDIIPQGDARHYAKVPDMMDLLNLLCPRLTESQRRSA